MREMNRHGIPEAVESALRLSASGGKSVPNRTVSGPIAPTIDHTLLKPEARPSDIERLCGEAKEHGFASVCINPGFVPLSSGLLGGSRVRVCTVIGFPLGATSINAKIAEAEQALNDGATELDMVINIGKLREKDYEYCGREIATLAERAHVVRALVKVIIETCLLTDDEKVSACAIAAFCGADFVKTSTGFSTGGATAADVGLMRRTVGSALGVKASGGIRTRADALAMIAAGANRIGTSSGVSIVREEENQR